MKNSCLFILFSITCFFFSCGHNEKKPSKKAIMPVNMLTPAPVKTGVKISSKNIKAPKEIGTKKTAANQSAFVVKNAIAITPVPQLETKPKNTNIDIKKEANDKLLNFVNIRKILDNCKMGQTMTQKQLTENFEIPEEAVKLVKSVTKTAENELSVKWKSTWLVEKVSDAELEDGKMKVKFKANKMYMSGNAIGIKYNRKIYNDLIIVGRSAYIPSVKGYSWQIGR
ncbi:hypothetical protein [Flavobacterium sp. KACC 22761]|uniref:hypothetical protein n=1 Tax=Flavobacterium sp. KACC 22761 TaxID=3092665 RepID=UPI002A74D076|nr:hypothetical protein [Flavobacterium sp. KACC 22761]WPO80682.1 hypothetical protein SCB73_09880 [Flavobacterium sp. KACC 22761]